MGAEVAPREWCEAEKLLASIYGFHHLGCSELQSRSDVNAFCGIFSRFVAALAPGASKLPLWPWLPDSDRLAVKRAADFSCSPENVEWFAEYGCALLSLRPGKEHIQAAPNNITLVLVGLDNWTFVVHSTSEGGTQHSATCGGSSIVHCGALPASHHASFFSNLRRAIAKAAEERKGDARTAAGGKQGHQKTPAFIHAMALQALQVTAVEAEGRRSQAVAEQQPRGGFTDCGLHTGGTPRDTAWPLARETIKAAMELVPECQSASPELFQLAEAHLHLWLLQKQVKLISPATATAQALNAAVQMLQTAARQAGKLATCGHDMAHFDAACQAARHALDGAAAERAQRAADYFTLPLLGGACLGSYRCPRGTVPPTTSARKEGSGLEQVKQRAALNLGSLPVLGNAVSSSPASSASFAELLQLLQSAEMKQEGDMAAQHALCVVERELFGRAATGLGAEAAVHESEMEALAKVVDTYGSVLSTFLGSHSSASRMYVDLRSREVLVAWVTYCIMWAACSARHPDLQSYGVGLDYRGLRHLALSDHTAVKTALAVADYLRSQARADRAVFTLRDGGSATFDLAEQYVSGNQGQELRQVWQEEVAAAAARQAAHWQEVQRKQLLAAQLAAQLEEDRAEEAAAREAKQGAAEEYDGLVGPWYRRQWSAEYQALQQAERKVQLAVQTCSETRSALDAALKSPDPVIQPLPQGKAAGYRWLFFLRMPFMLRQLARMSFLAQQLLLPRPHGKGQEGQASSKQVGSAVKAPSPKTSMADHYNSHQQSSYSSQQTVRLGREGRVRLVSDMAVPAPDKVRLPNVERYTCSTDGVWLPDSLSLRMGWSGSGHSADAAFSGWLNPFAAVPEKLVVEAFTERLPEGFVELLQWAMPQYGSGEATAPDRGNLAIAQQDKRPTWLSKPGWLAFGALRAYPTTQMRQLCVVLRERSLPWGHPAVQTLVRQALYHLGTLTNTGQLLWRTDWGAGGLLDTLCEELSALATELESAPREHASVLLLGEVAAYLSGWHPPLCMVARRFAGMAARWADELESSAREALPAQASPVRAKQCLLRQTALLCYGALGCKLGGDDVARMLGLAVQIHHGTVHGQGTLFESDLARLQVLCHWTMARRMDEILEAAHLHLGILTDALRLVLQRAPARLSWGCLWWMTRSLHSASFQAVGADGHLYSINCLDGTVLLDGSPPGRLPAEILGHRLYHRSFGEWGFQVSLGDDGVHRSVSPVKGRFYEFFMTSDNQLVVVEVDQAGQRLQLLDVGDGAACGKWGAELPQRLRELYSHWLSRDHGAILLRSHNFRSHEAHFIIQFAAKPAERAESVDYSCYRVPAELRGKPWMDLLTTHRAALTDQLVLHNSEVLQILSKFERPAFIHIYVRRKTAADSASVSCQPSQQQQGEQTLVFEFPRFQGLEFELRGERLHSLDYAGYALRRVQQLVWDSGPAAGTTYTLPGLTKYLVLEHASEEEQAGSSKGKEGQVGSGTGVSGGIPSTSSKPAGQHEAQLVLAPVGDVQRSDGQVVIQHSSSSDAQLEVHKYMVHRRFGHLLGGSQLANLQLAALYAATGSLLPEPGTQAIAAQTAMRLVRECCVNRPLSPAELRQLQSVALLGGHMAAGLRLLVHELQASASQLNSLHFPDGAPGHAQPPALQDDWATCYLQEKQQALSSGHANPRLLLSPLEEERALGYRLGVPTPAPPVWKRLRLFQPVHVPGCPVPADAVFRTERALEDLVVLAAGAPKAGTAGEQAAGQFGSAAEEALPPYPLRLAAGHSGDPMPLELEMHAELEESWREHHRCRAPTAVTIDAEEQIWQAQAQVQEWRQDAEAYLYTHLAAIPQSVGLRGTAHRLAQAAAAAPQQGVLDLVRLALDTQVAHTFNPFLSDEAVQQLQAGARRWLQLCVLEDRLGRLAQLVGETSQQALLIQELQVRREWSVDDHPEWLVFEAEQQLQIRPKQYWVAHHLMHNPGHILQLNMGEGKTRVILPMLVLHWAKDRELVRLNLLPPLLEEAYAHLHACLCASSLGRKLFVLPFHRDVRVTPAVIVIMHSALAHCKEVGGVLLTTPERRLSLLLKRQELWQQAQTDPSKEALYAGLHGLVEQPWIDMLDESDELLSHRYQLIYAHGSHIELPGEQARARAIQALLHILSCQGHKPSTPIGATLVREGVAVWAAGGASTKPGAFSGLRLLPGAALDSALPMLCCQLAEALMQDPPYALRWMQGHPAKDLLLHCMTDPLTNATVELEQVDERSGGMPEGQRCDVLALRGLLACGVLVHTLQMRHLVDYGVNRSATARKRLAGPFRAAHVPAERSEYAQPDTALALTVLSYYRDGLTEKEMLEALQVLLRLGQNVQRAVYDEWLQLATPSIPAKALAAFDDVAKLDTSNAQQMALLYSQLSHNMGAVDFWLNNCVFPRDSQQFPQRMIASAWHLADNPKGQVVGFSGTNDNHRLLPLQVRQHLEVEQSLKATNGKMLALLLENPCYDTLEVKADEVVWRALLHFAVREGVDALVDCGALLAGTSNRSAADALLPLLSRQRFKGVCYYDEGERAWTVVDLQGRRLPRHCSPIRESQAFTLFDEARCRGADLQLRPDAVGLLTLGPTTCKDKLMQAAGRLRRLGKGQTLRVAGTADITAKVLRAAGSGAAVAGSSAAGAAGAAAAAAAAGAAAAGPPAGPAAAAAAAGAAAAGPPAGPAAAEAALTAHPGPLTCLEVLQWVMANTVAATLRGVLEWAHQGLHFAATRGSPSHALVPEVLQVEQLYGASRPRVPLPQVVAEQRAKRARERLPPGMAQLMVQVEQRSRQYGQGHEVRAQDGLGEECERELEREEEEEEEVEREVPRVEARAERDWEYGMALGVASVSELQQRCPGLELLPLAQLAAQLQPSSSLAAIPWAPGVLCTHNFAYAVQLPRGGAALNEYLRAVDAVLLLPPEGMGWSKAMGKRRKQAGSKSSNSNDGPAVVLLSERECNGLLEALWQSAASSGSSSNGFAVEASAVLASLCYVASALQGAPLRLATGVTAAAGDGWACWVQHLATTVRAAAGVGGRGLTELGPSPLAAQLQGGALARQLVTLQLFNGETTYVKGVRVSLGWAALQEEPQLVELHSLVGGRTAAAEALVAMRGKQMLFPRSQLELACDAHLQHPSS